MGGASAPDLLRRLGEKVQLIHVEDGPGTGERKDQTAVGAGTLDIAAILAAAPRARRVVQLDDFTGDIFDAVRDSLRLDADERPSRMSSGPVGVGVIGAGVISDQYLKNLTAFPDLRVLFVADIDLGKKVWSEKPFALDRDSGR